MDKIEERYTVTDDKTGIEYKSACILDSIQTADLLRRLGHSVSMINTQSGAQFHWQGIIK